MAKRWNQLNAQTGRNYVSFADTQQLDGSNRLRISTPLNLSSQKFEYSEFSHDMEEQTTGTGFSTHLPLESAVLMSVPNPGDEIIRQTHEWFDYQPLNNQETAATAVFGPHEDKIEKSYGYSSGVNGVEIVQNEGKYWLYLYSSVGGVVPAVQKVPQDEWNIDRFQIAGKDKEFNPSGEYIDFSKFNISHFDIVWLGGDRSRVAIKYNGILYDAHEFLNAGQYDRAFLQTGSLPVRYRIKNNGSALGGSMKQICYTVRSEGGAEKFGIPHIAGVYNLPVAAATFTGSQVDVASLTPLLTIMPLATYFTLPNRTKARVLSFEILVKGNVPAIWMLIHDPIFAVNPTYTPVATTAQSNVPSMMSWATGTAAVNTITGKNHIHNAGTASAAVKGDISGGGDLYTRLMLSRGTFDHTDDQTADRYCFAIGGDGGAIASVTAIMRWAEIF